MAHLLRQIISADVDGSCWPGRGGLCCCCCCDFFFFFFFFFFPASFATGLEVAIDSIGGCDSPGAGEAICFVGPFLLSLATTSEDITEVLAAISDLSAIIHS